MKRYESKFEEDVEKLEEGAFLIDMQKITKQILVRLKDMKKGVKGENGSGVVYDEKHQDAETLVPLLNNMIKEAKQLVKSKGEIYLRNSGV